MNHRPRQLALDLVQPLRPSLDNFVVGRNAEAVAALRALVAGGGERFVLLWGGEGSGRTSPAACGGRQRAEPLDRPCDE